MGGPDARESIVAADRTSRGSLLAVHDLQVVYGQHITALRGVDVDIGGGEIVALLGSNGAGKTTLLRAMTGLLRFHDAAITGGRVLLRGQEVTRAPPDAIVRAGVAQVLEGGRLFDEMTVADNLATGAVVRGDRRAMAVRREEIFSLFPILGERRSWQAGYLSGGEKQMVAIGRALMSSPAILLLDEPSLGLAPMVVEQIRDVILDVNTQGTTVLLVEQNASMALSISDRAYILQNGTIAMSGPSAQLRDDRKVRDLYLGVGADGRRASYREARSGTTES